MITQEEIDRALSQPRLSSRIPKAEMRGGVENLARIGAESQGDIILDANADPHCKKCRGTGQIERPDRARGGSVCHCVMR